MARCPVCQTEIDEAAARAETGRTTHGASEVDPAKGTRRFHDGQWYYFDTLDCRTRFLVSPGAFLEQAGA